MKTRYAKAAVALLREGKELDFVLSGLQRVLATRGHEKLYLPILRAVVLILSKQSSTVPQVRVRDIPDAASYIEMIASDMADQFETSTIPTLIPDETIIGGYVLTYNHTSIDRSFKSKLIHLHRRITT